MKNEKLTISAIADKIEIQEVEVQADPCKNKDDYVDVYDCLVDCKGPNGTQTPYASKAY